MAAHTLFNGITLEAELLLPPSGKTAAASPSGASGKLPVLLVMGLGMQLTAWPQALIDGLLAAGHPVIRFDNRDVGLSTRRDEWGRPNLVDAAMRHTFGLRVQAPYTLHDMAADTTGLLDALELRRVHLVGVSMGGMIGQIVAALNPLRVASFTSVMSSSGARHLPGPSATVQRLLFSRPSSRDPEAMVEHLVKLARAMGSPGYPTPEAALRERMRADVLRSNHPRGVMRQMIAVTATGDRSRLLRDIAAPTRILHGRSDPLVPVAAAHDLAEKIASADLRIFDGMGHDLPDPLVPDLLAEILSNIARAD